MPSNKNLPTVDILGVPVAGLDQAELINLAVDWSGADGMHTIHYANAHCLNLAYQDATYRGLLNAADLVYADGAGPVWSSRWLGGCPLVKLTGADWIDPLCAALAGAGRRVFLLGGRPGIAQQAAETLLRRQPALKIVGIADGFFQAEPAEAVAAEIQASQAQLVLVGLGAPRQEFWIAEHRQALAAGVWWGVGALFDYLAGVERRVPAWMDHLGLEWLWRLGQDPSGKWRRYILGNPLFVYRVLRQALKTTTKE